MLVYYDLLANVELASDSFDEKEETKGVKAIISKRITVQEKEADIGANASADAGGEEDEGVEASEAKSVINVVHAANLQQVNLSEKEFKSYQKKYYKSLLEALQKNKYKALGFKSDYEPPEDKAEAKAAEEEAAKELSKFEIKGYENAVAAIEKFKTNFNDINKFVQDNIIGNFKEFEFYTGDGCEGDLGACMIIPARYIGEALAPVFYLFSDGIREKKE